MQSPPIYINIQSEQKRINWGAWILTALLASPAVAVLTIAPLNNIATGIVTAQRWLGKLTAGSIPPGTAGLNDEQLQNAQIIINTGLELGATRQDLIAAVATAYQESKLENLDYGDRDSIGLFQQRPSQDWGTPEQIADPKYAATAFFKGAGTNPGLLDVAERSNWIEASHQVQRSAFPDAPAQWEELAAQVVDAALKSQSSSSKTFPLPAGSYEQKDGYGDRVHPTKGIVAKHWGVDFAAAEGTPVLATESGIVESTISSSSGCGNEITLKFADGNGARYCHLSSIDVVQDQQVTAGEAIGKVGSTGESTGPHLHFERIENGSSVDPTNYLASLSVNGSQSPAPELPKGGIVALTQTILPAILLKPKPVETIVVVPVAKGDCAGVTIAPNQILTANHCIETPSPAITTKSGEQLQGTVVKQDDVLDLALIEISGNLPAVATLAATTPQDGEAMAIGHGRGQHWQQDTAPIMGRWHDGTVKLSGGIVPGDSGGGLFVEGQLIGINIAMQETTGEGKAQPIEAVRQFLEQ